MGSFPRPIQNETLRPAHARTPFGRVPGLNALAFALTLLAFVPSAWPVITISNVTGASNYIPAIVSSTTTSGSTTPPTTTQNAEIFGGTAGQLSSDPNPCSTDNNGNIAGCNNCKSTTEWDYCNPAAVYPNLQLQITFSSSTSDGYPGLVDTTTSTNVPLSGTPVYVTHPTVMTLVVPWTNVCGSSSTHDTSCATGFTNSTDQFSVGVTSTYQSTSLADSIPVNIELSSVMNATGQTSAAPQSISDSCTQAANETGAGACGFQLFPGDSSAYITESDWPPSFPAAPTTGMDFGSVYFFYNTDSSTPPYPGLTGTQVTQVQLSQSNGIPTAGLAQNYIGGLNNGTTYYFVMASADQANNIGFYVLNSTDTGHSVTPDAVVGLLPKSLNCFIATAAYGSPFAAKVETFRRFRDRFLLMTKSGQAFVRWYYRTSPYWAHKISPHPVVRAVVRAGLWPLWAFSAASLRWGVPAALVLGFGLLMMLAIAIRLLLSRRAKGRVH